MTSPTYQVTQLDVRDPDAMRRYQAGAIPLLRSYGGDVLALSRGKVIEGDWHPSLLVVHRWESLEAFETFYAAPEYQELKALRHEASDSRLVLLKAFAG